MKRIYTIIFAAVALFAACEEFQPVFTGKYPMPPVQETEVLEPTHTIAQLAAMYEVNKPWKIDQDIIIAGKVATNDQPGNFYKSLYIQDATGGMEIKIGRNGLYNEYKPGQTIYVKCKGLTLGMYGHSSTKGMGMVQIGYVSTEDKYETSYIEHPLLVERHIVKGPLGDPVEPVVLTEGQLPGANDTQVQNKYIGTLVTINDLKYGNQTFTLIYLDSNKDKDASENRIFLSDETWGITTWAMSESKMKEYITSGIWDSCTIGGGTDNFGTVGSKKEDGTYPGIEKAAYSVSQYFKAGGTDIQIRTSGYCKFSDAEIDPAILDGSKTINVTGILTMYQGSIQFILIDLNGVEINE